MADIPRIRSNIERMIAQGAPEADIDRYVSSEGVSVSQLMATNASPRGDGTVMSDVAQSIPAGLARGAAALAGLPGDVSGLVDQGVKWVGDKVGLQSAAETARPRFDVMPTTSAVTSAMEGVTGPLYKPQTTAGKYANSVAEFMPGMLSPGSVGRRFAAGVLAPGLASEGAGQATEGTSWETPARIAGAVAGGLGATTALSARAATQGGVPGMSVSASKELERSLPAGAEQRLAQFGPEAMLLDAGQPTLQTAQGVAIRTGSDRLVAPLTARHNTSNQRLARDLDDTLGPAVAPSGIEQSLANQRSSLGELYGQVADVAGPVDLRAAYQAIMAELPEQAGRPRDILNRALDMVAPQSGGQRRVRSSAREALNVRQALDDEIARLADQPNAHRVATEVRRLVDNALGDAAPDIKILDGTYAGLSRESAALERGRDLFTKERTAIRPEDLIAERQAMRLPEREAMRHGARAELERVVATKPNDTTALRQVFQNEGDWNPVKLAEVFGGAEAQRIMRAVDREAAFKDAFDKIVHNSQTAQRMTAAKRLDAADSPTMSSVTIPGMFIEGTRKAGKALSDAVLNGRRASINEELASALTSSGAPRDSLVRAIRTAQQKRGAKQTSASAELARALLNTQGAIAGARN